MTIIASLLDLKNKETNPIFLLIDTEKASDKI